MHDYKKHLPPYDSEQVDLWTIAFQILRFVTGHTLWTYADASNSIFPKYRRNPKVFLETLEVTTPGGEKTLLSDEGVEYFTKTLKLDVDRRMSLQEQSDGLKAVSGFYKPVPKDQSKLRNFWNNHF